MSHVVKKEKYLINCSNLHVGGGVQVATSFISELSKTGVLPDSLFFWVSSQVDSNLRSLGVDVSNFENYEVIDSFGLSFVFSSLSRRLSEFDRVFTIFGPLYSLNRNFFSIVGFAQAWIIYPDNDVYSKLSFLMMLRLKLKFFIQKQFFRHSDLLIVELEHVAKGLCDLGIARESTVKVIHNCVSSIYFNKSNWSDFNLESSGDGIKIGFLGRNYIHKNTDILPMVRLLLREKFNLSVDFYVTFTDDEWVNCSDSFKRNIFNVGALSLAQCPKFYESMDAIIFPSLLECFSATPLEAMIMEKPLFVSDRDFNRDICLDFSIYFDPLSPMNVAESIARYFLDESYKATFSLFEAKKHAFTFSSANKRAKQYLGYVTESI